ncbi:MAG: hypothetical protein KAQ98_13910 [Bacteriovoracaceae bacterium]|nr:hypothetical protein [Bacteriovoracaceae bacterium]
MWARVWTRQTTPSGALNYNSIHDFYYGAFDLALPDDYVYLTTELSVGGFKRGLPKFLYLPKYKNATYDILGNVLSGEEMVEELKIFIPQEPKTETILFNVQSGVKTNILVNTKKYLNCLKDGVQKNAPILK